MGEAPKLQMTHVRSDWAKQLGTVADGTVPDDAWTDQMFASHQHFDC